MTDYYQFKKSTGISLCDCVVNSITSLSDKLIIHIPNGLVSIRDDNKKYTSAIDANIVGCGIDSVLFYKIRRWSFFGKQIKTMSIVDSDDIEHLFSSGYKIRISEEYFAFKSMFIKGRILNRNGKSTTKELIILLNDIDYVDFTTAKNL